MSKAKRTPTTSESSNEFEEWMDQANPRPASAKAKADKPPDPAVVQQKFRDAQVALSNSLVDRDEEIELCLTALIAQEHVLIVGPPGTAKSTLMEGLMSWLQASKFDILMTMFTTPEDLAGPVSVKGLKNDEFYRRTANMMPEAVGVFADEIWKSSPAILNTLLDVLQSRSFKNGTKGRVSIPLKFFLAASNEYPQSGGLSAIFDRLLFRKTIQSVSSNRGLKELLRRAVDNQECKPKFASSITPEELDLATQVARTLPWSNDGKRAMWAIVEELKKQQVFPSNRRLVKSVQAARASAFLSGEVEVKKEHLQVLSHVLWDQPGEQEELCEKIVTSIANRHGQKVNNFRLQVESILEKGEEQLKDKSKSRATICSEVKAELEEVQKELEVLAPDPKKDKLEEHLQEQIQYWTKRSIGLDRVE